MSFFNWFNNHIRNSNQKWMNSSSSSSSSSSSCNKCCANCAWLDTQYGRFGSNGWGTGYVCTKHNIEFNINSSYGTIDDSKLYRQTCDDFMRK